MVYATSIMNVYARLWWKGTGFDVRESNENWKMNFMHARETESGQWVVCAIIMK